MSTLTQKQVKKLEELNLDIPEEIVAEYISNSGDEELENLEEAYAGHFKDEKDFAMDMAENCGDVNFKNYVWPLTCIDWDQAASELMLDYSCDDSGHYFFRNL